MIEFRQIDDANPALAHSPMVRALEKTFAYIAEHGGIGLTPSKAFKRVFVHWAAREFDWPGYTEEDLFAINKVLNEIDFGPLMDLHDVVIALKIGRHYKGQFKLTKAGQGLVGHPGRIFGIVTPFYLFEVNHARFSRFDEPILGNWDVFLNVLNVETEDGATGADLRQVLFGEPDPAGGFDDVLSRLYIQVLRPLCWTGLLHMDRAKGFRSTEQSVFTKTPLWKAALRLETDRMAGGATRH
ncbi:hypothetical protein ROE7235_03711 [Roseibaca ekhonensis]|uniref:Uncharacterized protein n=2 Tax=Rhodobacterales TaxID=204455 RepID=A0A1Y5TSG7_9RHOB|nr:MULTISPECIES: hypothetical protein [Rhodobacterales]SLN67179.1 hypothetical protein ROA7023_03224 [Roseisalinus antarcticus]SUZ33930.1 hypothetical protein ROE7235_03711 [Roseibaca ekhonensis]